MEEIKGATNKKTTADCTAAMRPVTWSSLMGPNLKGTCLSGDVQCDPFHLKKSHRLRTDMHWNTDRDDILPEDRDTMVSWQPLGVPSIKHSYLTD